MGIRSRRRRPAARSVAEPAEPMEKDNQDDRISSLPNDILVNILDRLKARAAVKTKVLSRRWSQLPDMLPRLTISARDLRPSKTKTSMSNNELFQRSNAAVVKATESVLAHRDLGGCTIDLLSTTFYLKDDAPISIGRTVGNAMATHKIEKVEFTVLTEKERQECTFDDMEKYGTRFVSFFNECLNAFAGLTRLCLQNLTFRESVIVSNILVTCKQLKYLDFHYCRTEGLILDVEHTQLSELSIVNCRFGLINLTMVPKLTRLVFEYWTAYKEPPLSFGYVPLLEVLSLATVHLSWHKMVKLSTFLYGSSVRDLRLCFRFEKIWVQPECLTKRLVSVLHQLRIVNLVDIPEGYDLTWTMFILEAAPSVEELYMKVMDHPCEMHMDKEKRRANLFSENKGVEWKPPASHFKHHRLAKLIIFCFESLDYMVNHVRCVMKAAVNLQDVYLYNRLACNKCRNVMPPRLIKFPETVMGRHLEGKLLTWGIESPATIHFQITPVIRAEHRARML